MDQIPRIPIEVVEEWDRLKKAVEDAKSPDEKREAEKKLFEFEQKYPLKQK